LPSLSYINDINCTLS